MRFEWDEAKARANLRKHDVFFEWAVDAFQDPLEQTVDIQVIDGEIRSAMIGATRLQVLLYVVYALRDEDGEEVVRIISARGVTRHERRIYETRR